MADDELVNQDEIEALLAQAQGGAKPPKEEPPAPAAPADSGQADYSLDQSEIEALISGAPTVDQVTGGGGGGDAPSGAGSMSSDVELLLNKAQAAIASVDEPSAELPPGVSAFNLKDFSGTPPNRQSATLELVRDVQLDLRIELGRTRMHLEDVLRIRQGAVVPLDKLAGDPVDVFVNGRIVARGEVLVLNDNFCVRVTELVSGENAA